MTAFETYFPTYFPSTHLGGDVVNVMDPAFGATGLGIADDQPAIQAAVDSLGVNAGTVFFPPGTYKVNAPISLDTNGNNKSIILLGCGNASQITGSVNGYIIDKSGTDSASTQYIRKVSQLYIHNSHASGGGIRLLGSAPASVRDCWISAHIGITADNNSVIDVANCKISGIGGSGGYGVAVGGECTIYKCDITAMAGDAIRISGISGSVIGCRCEINAGYAINAGTNSAGSNAGASGWLISGNSLEGNGGGIYTNGLGFSKIAGNTIHGEDANGSVAGLTIPPFGCSYTIFSGLECYGDFSTATPSDTVGHSIFIGFGCQGLVFQGVDSFISTPGHGTDWMMHQEDCTQFIGCNQPAPTTATYANKPGTSGGGPLEGDLHTFTDSNTATFGDEIAGGGANKVVGRYSTRRSKWTVVALA